MKNRLSEIIIVILLMIGVWLFVSYRSERGKRIAAEELNGILAAEGDRIIEEQKMVHENNIKALSSQIDSLKSANLVIDQKRKRQEIYYRNEISNIKNFTPTLRRHFLDSLLRANELN